jgi:soluble lytic murein transglycosylase-like protein
VAWCESRWNPRATGSAGERGLMQLHPSWFGRRIGRYTVDGSRLYQPAYNLKIAAELRRVGGWGHWTCAR